MMITAIRAGCVDILRVCGVILGGGVLDGVRRGVGVAGMVPGGVGAGGVRAGVLGGAGLRHGILGGAGGRPMRGRDGIIRRGGAGATMRGPAGGWRLLALALPIVLATTIGRVLTLLPAEARLTRHLGVQ
jgi:hypothetical protein